MKGVALWVGDSFTAGEGARCSPDLTYPHLVSSALGWACHVDAQCGTGFVNDGWAASPDYGPLIRRLSRHPRVSPDVVIIDAGRNDAQCPAAQARRAVEEYLDALGSRYPKAAIVLVAPTLVDVVQPPDYERMGAVLRASASKHSAAVVDPAAAGAFADAGANRRYVCEDGFHPSAAGQERYAEVLTPLLSAAIGVTGPGPADGEPARHLG